MILLFCLLTPFLGLACGFLWAYGGAHNTSLGWRRIGVPLAIYFVATTIFYFRGELNITTTFIIAVACIFEAIAISLPYGIPDAYDDGGVIGRFWEYFFGNSIWTNIMTRVTVGAAYGAPLTLFSFTRGFGLLGVVACIACALNTVYWGAIQDNKPPIVINGLVLNNEEFNIGMGVALCTILALL